MADRVHRPDLDKEVVLSCPACWKWQLHYTPADLVPSVFRDDRELEETVEWLLRDHIAHYCEKPLFFAQLAKIKGVI